MGVCAPFLQCYLYAHTCGYGNMMIQINMIVNIAWPVKLLLTFIVGVGFGAAPIWIWMLFIVGTCIFHHLIWHFLNIFSIECTADFEYAQEC